MSSTAMGMEVDSSASSSSGVGPGSSSSSVASNSHLPPRPFPYNKPMLTVATPIIHNTSDGNPLIPPSSPSYTDANKRHRTGEYTPGGTQLATLTPWSVETPSTPTTALLSYGMAGVNFGNSTPITTATPTKLYPIPHSPTSSATTANSSAVHSSLPPAHPPANPLAALPPTSPSLQHLVHTNGVTNPSTSPLSSIAASMASPVRSRGSSNSSSPSSFSLAAPSGSTNSSVSSISSSVSASTVALSPLPVSVVNTPPPIQIQSQPQYGSVMNPVVHTPAHDQMDDEEDTSNIAGGKKKSGLSGASCHQCKTTKDESHLLFCTTKAGGNRKRRCRKKYCDSCLSRTYGVNMSQVQANASNWVCPSCLGRCTCAGCTRKTGPVPSTPASTSTNGNGHAAVSQSNVAVANTEVGTSHGPATQTPSRKRSAAGQPVHHSASHSSDSHSWNASGHTANSSATVLPLQSVTSVRALSAPNHESQNESQLKLSDPSHSYHTSSLSTAPSSDESVPAGLVSPPSNLDAIASLLLELSTTGQSEMSMAGSNQSNYESSSMATLASSAAASSGRENGQGVAPTSTSTFTSSTLPPSTIGSTISPSSLTSHLVHLPPSFTGRPITTPSTVTPSSIRAVSALPSHSPTMSPLFSESAVGLTKRFPLTPTSILTASNGTHSHPHSATSSPSSITPLTNRATIPLHHPHSPLTKYAAALSSVSSSYPTRNPGDTMPLLATPPRTNGQPISHPQQF